MLLRRQAVALGLQHLQGANDLRPGLRRVYNVVEETPAGGDVGGGEEFLVFVYEFLAGAVGGFRIWIFALGK